jgi:hypothetical protein
LLRSVRALTSDGDAQSVAATTGIFTTLLNQGAGLLREWWTNKWHDDADLTEGANELNYSLPTLASYPQDVAGRR